MSEQKQLRPVEQFKQVVYKPSVQQEFKNALGDDTSLFTASLIDVYTNDKTLQQCDPNAVAMEALKAATLKLPVNKDLGFAYVIPYKGKPQMQMGYKGYIQLAMRSGQYRTINADKVYEGELVKFDKVTGEIDLSGTPTSNKVIGYFAHFETIQGFRKTIYWTKEQIVEHARHFSQSYNSKTSPWQTNFDAMAKKTVLKQLISKYGVMTVETTRALQEDEQQAADVEAKENENQEIIDVESSETSVDEETGEVFEDGPQPEPEPDF